VSEIYEKGTAAERAAFEDHQRLARATTIPAQPGAPVRQFASDEERYAFMDAADANHAQRIRDVRAARAGATPTPAATPPAPVARPTPPSPPSYSMNIPSIAAPTPAADADTANINYMPSTSRGAQASTDGSVTAYVTDPRRQFAVAESHIDMPSMDLAAEARNLEASVKQAEERLAKAPPEGKAMAQQQLSRAQERAVFGMQRLEAVARARSGK
jgi:hypothetical protein